ncbi:MAG: hypothetical protein HOI66_13795, partial [Verrucomicrobia bacterium]|nr:hypothetical protein [Verrucomicrobiota bacterium]
MGRLLACWCSGNLSQRKQSPLIKALSKLLKEIRREKHSIRSVLLEGVFWRLLIIQAIIIGWSMIDLWFSEEPTTGEVLRHGLRLGILSTLALAFIVITLGSFLSKRIIAPMEKIAEANRQLKDKEQTAMQVPISKEAPKEIRDIV